jgi:hypothetical protein
MNPYQTPAVDDESRRSSGLLLSEILKIPRYSRYIGAICLVAFGLGILADRTSGDNWIDGSAAIFWAAVASVLVWRPRVFGLPIAILAIGGAALRLHYTGFSVATTEEIIGLHAGSRYWCRFWLSEAPLVFGGIFAVVPLPTERPN